MDLAIELLGIGFLVPATIAAVVTWVGLRIPGPGARGYAMPAAVAVAYVTSYVLLPDWAAIKPERHWQWLPYLALAAAAVATLRFGRGRPLFFVLMTLLPVGAACLLVPAWPDLRPSRPASILLLALYLSSLVLAVESLSFPLSPSSFFGLLIFGAGSLSMALAAIVSFRFGVLSAIAAGAFTGCWVALICGRRKSTPETRHLAPLYAALVGGAAYVGCIEPQPPLWWLLLIPVLPLAIGFPFALFRPYRASASSGQ